MRIQFLMGPDRRAESCTVLVRDIPGVYYGTAADRVERTALRFLPSVVKRKIVVRLPCHHCYNLLDGRLGVVN